VTRERQLEVFQTAEVVNVKASYHRTIILRFRLALNQNAAFFAPAAHGVAYYYAVALFNAFLTMVCSVASFTRLPVKPRDPAENTKPPLPVS
jgi:hypothetical protein